jgi:hypothetical protein
MLAGAVFVAVLGPSDSLTTFLAILTSLILLPLSIVLYIDYVRSLHHGDAARELEAKSSVALRAPIVCFGVVAVALGTVIAGWYLYNTFIERLPAFRDPPWFVTFGIAPSMIAFGWHLIRRPSSYP